MLLDMYRLRELKDYEKPRVSSCLVWKLFSPSIPNQALNGTLSYHTPEYIRLYKKFLDTDLGTVENNNAHIGRLDTDGRIVWKPCQSYESRVVEPRAGDDFNVIPWWSNSVAGYYPGYAVSYGGIDREVVAGYRAFTDAFGVFGLHNAGLPSMMETNIGTLSFVPKPTGLNVLVQRSLRAMLPHVKNDVSLVNSIIELKDFASLPHTLSNIRNTLSKILGARSYKGRDVSWFDGIKNPVLARKELSRRLGNWFGLVRSTFDPSCGLTLREILHSTADGYLQAQFNLLPLFRDMQSIYNALVSVSKRMNKLVNEQGRLQKRHYTFKFVPSQFTGANRVQLMSLQLDQFAGYIVSGSTGICYRALAPQLRVTRECLVNTPSTFHAEIEYSYKFTQYQNEHARLLGLLDILGVNLNPAIIWNALPWSFVIDWFLGVSRWLNDRAVINMEPAIGISRYMWSWKSERVLRTYFEYSSPTVVGPQMPRVYLKDLVETIYRRDVEMPSVSNSLFGSEFSSTELSLAGALAITRAYRPSRGRSGKRPTNASESKLALNML